MPNAMNSVERVVREVSEMWDFARRTGWLYKTPEYQEAFRTTANRRVNPGKRRARNATTKKMTHADQVIRKVSELRDLIHFLKAAPVRTLTDEERTWRTPEPSKESGSKSNQAVSSVEL